MTNASLSQRPPVDVAIAGGGPAGLLLAAALVEQGLSVSVVTPAPEQLWVENHASWLDELDAAGLGDFLAPRWDDVVVIDSHGVPFDLVSGYGMVDKESLQPHLRKKIQANGTIVDDKVVAIEPIGSVTKIELEHGSPLQARFFVDASGGRAALGGPRKSDATLFQTALGITIETNEHSRIESPNPQGAGTNRVAPTNPMVLMDWRQPPFGGGVRADAAREDGIEPSFVYVMPLGQGRFFVEETILIGGPRSPEELRPRLNARVAARFGSVTSITDTDGRPLEEHCVIPMNARAAAPNTAGTFGAAAGAIHPATGYSIGWSARHAGVAATTIAEGLLRDDPPDAIAKALWATLWSKDAEQSRRLLQAGAEVLVGLSADDVSHFFTAFFAQPQDRWMAFMTRNQNSQAILRAMWGTFARVPFGLKAKMMRLGLGPLARAAVG